MKFYWRSFGKSLSEEAEVAYIRMKNNVGVAEQFELCRPEVSEQEYDEFLILVCELTELGFIKKVSNHLYEICV